MTRRGATLAAALITMACYVAIAWIATAIAIPSDVPTAHAPWFRPFRVVATLGFGLASVLHLPHVAGQFLAAIILGSVLGAVFATARHWIASRA